MIKTVLNNRLRYYFGVRLSDGKVLLTTSSTKLAEHIGISRATVYRQLKGCEYTVNTEYIIGWADHINRQDKGNRRQLRTNLASYHEMKRKMYEYYNAEK